ncbi:MAG: DegT/DnrJ/EryC1/StrS family aminotransferase [Candidatus Odinarchaeota archaeon]
MNDRILMNDFVAEYHDIRNEINSAITEVLESGWLILGDKVKEFERKFSQYCGANYAIGVANGTDALVLIMRALDIGNGDEVIVPSNTAFPTANAITLAGARPVFADVDPVTYNININTVLEKVTPKTRAVIPVHLFGCPADMDPILEFAEESDIHVIEDACQSHGAEYKGKKAGSRGVASAFSFYPTKNLGAYGDGGMVITNDSRIDEEIRSLREYGQVRKNYHGKTGYNSRLDELQASILLKKLGRLDIWNDQRRKNSKIYADLLEDTVILPREPEYAKHVFHLFVIRSKKRDQLMEWLSNKGVHTMIHYPLPLHLQPAYNAGPDPVKLPVCELLSKQILSLPIHPYLKEEDIIRISEFINKQHF